MAILFKKLSLMNFCARPGVCGVKGTSFAKIVKDGVRLAKYLATLELQ